ncbi:MAG: hypothetical protein NVS4B12_23890 [Ktedonobacteraceae bacterium]
MLKQRYVILIQVGKGGFGAVYKAADTQFGNRLVAIKEMSQSNMNQQELLEATVSFKREALMLASLTHPNLPRIYEQFTDAGRSYLVMDFIEGKTLEEHLADLKGSLLPSTKILAIGIQLCDVLDYLHSSRPQPIIFRDLKPANVMLTLTGHIYLIDFGIARHFKPGQTKDTTALGSTGYAAPEQYGKAQTTPHADIYSLGATLHQLMTGHDPSESPFTFSPITLKEPTLVGLDTLIAGMVSVDINKRPTSVLIVKQELQRIAIEHQLGQTHPLRHTLPTAYSAPTTLSKVPKSTRGITVPQIPPMSNMLFACYGHSSRVTALAWSPNGKWIASASYDKTVQVWDATNGNQLLTYKEHRNRVNALTWSPDSTRLASASDDGTVRVWSHTSGTTFFTYSGHTGPVNALSWSPTLSAYGNTLPAQIASAGTDKTVHIWDATTGTNQYIFRSHSGAVYAVAWSPDGKRVASAGEDRAVLLWYPSKEQLKKSFLTTLTSMLSLQRDVLKLNSHDGRVNGLAWSPDSKYIASASSDHRILIRDALTGTSAYSYGSSRKSMKNCVAWSPNGKHLASGGNDKTVEIWSKATKGSSFVYYGHIGYVTSVAWSPDSSRIASAGVDRTIQVWQAV